MEENDKSMKSLNSKEEPSSKINKDNFFLTINNDIYSLNLTKNEKNDKIIIKANIETNLYNNSKYYENSFSLEELISKSKPFKLCDTLDEALNIFLDILNAKKASLYIEDENNDSNINNNLLFVIKISLPGGQEQNAEFELFPKKMNKDEYIDELIKIIRNLQKENEKLKNDNYNLINEIKYLKNNLGINNKYENKRTFNLKNKSFDSKRNILYTEQIYPNDKYFKYGYNDIHNNTDIHSIINYNSSYNPKNINTNKLNNKDETINFKPIDNNSKFFQTTLSSFKRGKLAKNSNNSSQITNDFFEIKNIPEKENLKETKESKAKEKLNVKKKISNKSKNKKKEIELNNVIYIKNYLNTITMIPIEDYISIKQIKSKYCAKKCIPIKGKELYYRGIKLSDDKNLEFYKIPWESTLHVLNVPDKINVFVRNLSGKEFKIIVDEIETILKIKFKIYEYENIPIDKQIILIDKKILDDDKMIREFNINGDVHLLVRRKEEK